MAEGVLSRHNILSLYLPSLILSVGSGIVAPALPVYARSFGVDFGMAALVIILYDAGSVAATIPAGYLIDKVGRRPILLAGPALTAVASFMLATAGSFPEVLLYRFAGGLASQMWFQARLTMISDRSAAGERGRQIVWMSSLQRGGQLMGPTVGGFLAALVDIRAPFILHGVLTLVAIIPSVLMSGETAPARKREPGSPGEWGPLFHWMRGPQVLAFLIASFLANLTRGALQGGTINLYAVYAYDVGPEVLGLLSTSTSVVVLPISFASGWLLDRFGRRATMVPGYALLGAAAAAMAINAHLGFGFMAFVAIYFWMQAANSLTAGSMQVIGADLAPPVARGRFFGFWRFLASGGHMTSPAAFAVLAASAGYAAGFTFVTFSGMAVALLIGVTIKEARRQTGSPAHDPGSP